MSKVRDILGTDRDNEFLQSFVRVGIKADEEDNAIKSVYSQPKQQHQQQQHQSQHSGVGGAGGDGPAGHQRDKLAATDMVRQSSEVRSEGNLSRPSRTSLQGDSLTRKKSRKRREYFDEIYTDKDRAAAVSFGSYDIKQSLSIKRRQDRTEALQLPDDSDPGALYELGLREYKSGNTDTAVLFISKALELNPGDQNALVTRSKCYLLLGEPDKGLRDAEEALLADKANIRAIYQKAEALYFLGEFEHSLMFFHRGLRLRPELNTFRLGVQKSREAIEKTIGGFVPKAAGGGGASTAGHSARRSASTTARRGSTATTAASQLATGSMVPAASAPAAAKAPSELTMRSATSGASKATANRPQTTAMASASAKSAAKPGGSVTATSNRRRRTTTAPGAACRMTPEQREAKRLLGELCVDKAYLENLLKNPSIRRADAAELAQPIASLARDAVQFLNTRQEFWRQQRPCTAALPALKKRLAEGAVLR